MNNNADQQNTIQFSSRKAASPAFTKLYSEGMALVEETAAYLETEGREEAKKLKRVAATLYAAESMRLTTRLMQLASWLLLQRALNSGEMSEEQVRSEKDKIRLDTNSSNKDVASWNELPEKFNDLVRRSLSLQAQVRTIDDGGDLLEDGAYATQENPVLNQVNLLKTAFGAK
jgi:regulator of CtrA degradation